MDKETIIVRRPTTDEETSIGIRLSTITEMMTQLLSNLGKEYFVKDPVRYEALFNLCNTLLNAEADFFGFNSWDDLTKWQKIHGGILKEIEIE